MVDQNRDDNKPQERTLNFALLIQQTISARGIEHRLETQNQGISDSEVILLVESWLDAVKDKFKKRIKDGLFPPDNPH